MLSLFCNIVPSVLFQVCNYLNEEKKAVCLSIIMVSSSWCHEFACNL